MDENMKTPLFLDEPTTIEEEHIEKKDEADTDTSIEAVMEDSLNLVQQLATSKKKPNSSTTILGCKKYGPTYKTCKCVSFCLYLLVHLLYL